jgi:phosphatidylinositol glycan class H protein
MANFLSQLTSPPAQTLRILQPTSSTITYTVSSRPVPSTLPAKALHYISILLRVLLGLATILALWAKWFVKDGQSIDYLRAALGSTEKEAQLLKAISAFPCIYLAPSAVGVLLLVFRRGYTGTSLISRIL